MRGLTRTRVLLALGVALVAVGTWWGLGEGPGGEAPILDAVVASLAVLIGLLVALGQLHRGADAPDPSTDAPLVEGTPEVTSTTAPVAGRELADLIERAGEAAREGWTVEDGIETARAELRETLVAAMVAGGTPREAAEAAIEDGAWTEDRAAAAVLSASVEPPPRSLPRRVAAWLYPERAVRRRVTRAVAVVADEAERTLPQVPGQTAMRTVPVIRPGVDDLRGHVDGSIQPAANPEAIRRAPREEGDR